MPQLLAVDEYIEAVASDSLPESFHPEPETGMKVLERMADGRYDTEGITIAYIDWVRGYPEPRALMSDEPYKFKTQRCCTCGTAFFTLTSFAAHRYACGRPKELEQPKKPLPYRVVQRDDVVKAPRVKRTRGFYPDHNVAFCAYCENQYFNDETFALHQSECSQRLLFMARWNFYGFGEIP